MKLDKFAEGIKRARELHYEKRPGFEVAEELKITLDNVLKPAFAETFGGWNVPVALYALGGYGRGELNFHSDIDVNVVYVGELSKRQIEDIEKFYYFLLSLNRDLGFSPRSLDEALELSKSDLSVFTNFLQRRFLCGDETIEKKFSERFVKFTEANKENLINEILSTRKDRYKRFYGTVYYQEPNVKESKGGLRDLHEAFWIAKLVYGINGYSGFLDEKILDRQSFREVISAYDLLLRVRNHLHIAAGRKSDILSFEMQKEVATFFGFPKNRKGVESFMKNYFNAATDISVITKEIIKTSIEKLSTGKKSVVSILLTAHKEDFGEFFAERGLLFIKKDYEGKVLKDPKLVLKGFKIVQRKGVSLSPRAFSLFKLSAETQREKFREVLKEFKEILLNPKRLSFVLETMHEARVLGALIPDFERLRGHFQYDTYHKFTTDIHSILTVRELEKLEEKGTNETPVREKQELSQILQDLEKPHTLFVAALFHDVGKGKPGRHELVGAGIARKYLRSMGFTESDAEEVSWLVRNHLLMSHLAFRRDITDPKLIEEFKKTCENEERLKKLFLLTYADIKAVGPGAWNKWKSSLLWQLYSFTLNLFSENKSAQQLVAEKLKRRKEKVKQLLKGKVREESLEEFFKKADENYLITYPSSEIAKHVLMMKTIRKEGIDYKLSYENFPNIGFTKVTIVTKYRRGLFNKICGIFSSLGVNIKGANIDRAIRDDCDCMVYTIQVSTVADEPLSQDKLEEFERKVRELYAGKLDVEKLNVSMRPKTFRTNVPLPETKVKIDNKSSEKYTIVEVSTLDRIGVLYAITKTLLQLNTRLRRALITTEGNRVIDSFYITDINYRKITDQEVLEELKERIEEAIK